MGKLTGMWLAGQVDNATPSAFTERKRMRHWIKAGIVLLGLSGGFTTEAQAQEEITSEPVAPVEELSLDQSVADSARATARAWMDAWRATPKLVSLKETEEESDVAKALQSRMKRLGEKGFSNREWKTYWQHQVETASAFSAELEKSNAVPDRLTAIKAWVALAEKKVANQEVYFEAIQSERDSLESRLEALLEPAVTEETANSDAVDEESNPYERLRLHKSELSQRIEAQKAKLRLVESERLFVENQLASEEILAKALETDLALAHDEQGIATVQALGAGGWASFWTEVASKSDQKVLKIAAENEYGEVRQRGRKVELRLGQSQVDFRKRRLDELKAELESVSGFSSQTQAMGETLYRWVLQEAWKVGIGLLLLYLLVRLALRLLSRGVILILERTDDDPDTEDDGDQRRKTLADVFASVARIAIYIIAALIALEQIGVDTGPILGSVAILGLAISFGSQNLVRDLVNGFFILLENQFAVGDVVSINGKTGSVERISIRSTWIRQFSGDLHVIPNGSITMVSNSTRGWSRSIVEVGVSYDADLEEVRKVVEQVGQEMYDDESLEGVLDELPQWGGVTKLGDSAVNVRVVVKVSAGSQWSVNREFNRRLKVAFDKAGIEIPYPQQVVHHLNQG